MKIDLDDLKRKAQAAVAVQQNIRNALDDATHLIDDDVADHLANSPRATLALIARIRELEEALEAHLAVPGGWDEAGERLLNKGAVLQ